MDFEHFLRFCQDHPRATSLISWIHLGNARKVGVGEAEIVILPLAPQIVLLPACPPQPQPDKIPGYYDTLTELCSRRGGGGKGPIHFSGSNLLRFPPPVSIDEVRTVERCYYVLRPWRPRKSWVARAGLCLPNLNPPPCRRNSRHPDAGNL